MYTDHENSVFARVHPTLLWMRQQMADLLATCVAIKALADAGISAVYADACGAVASQALSRLNSASSFADLDHAALTAVDCAFECARYLDGQACEIRHLPPCDALRAFVRMRPGEDLARGIEFTAYYETRRRLISVTAHETHERLYTAAGITEAGPVLRQGLVAYDHLGRILVNPPALFTNIDILAIARGGVSCARAREDVVFAVDTRGYDVVRYPFCSGGDIVRHVLASIPASRLTIVGHYDFESGWRLGRPASIAAAAGGVRA